MSLPRAMLLAVLVPALCVARAEADGFADRATVTLDLDKSKAKPGEIVTWKVTLTINKGYHSYPMEQGNGAESEINTRFYLPKFGDFIFVDGIEDFKPNSTHTEGGKTYQTIEGQATWQGRFIVHPQAKPGMTTLKLRATLPVCDNNGCTSGTPPEKEFEIIAGSVAVDEKYRDVVSKFPLEKPKPPVKPVEPARGPETPKPVENVEEKAVQIASPADTLEEHVANLNAVRAQIEPFEKTTVRSKGLLGFLAMAAFWGAISLITPCVFPMIPITVSFFLHQSEHEHHRPLKNAIIYCATIILVLGFSALTLLTFFRALSVHWATNIALGGLFLFFALSLFGLYEITLPHKLTAFTSSREGRGGVVGTVFMALTFTIVSFTCVAPFLGGFSGMAASGQFATWELALGALVFSTTFASPFFVLAMFPSLIKKLPQSGSWLNSVKVVMGFLELAAALKFLRTAELRILPEPTYFTYDLVLGIWVALAVICGLYLLNIFRLHHDAPRDNIGVVRMLIGLGFVGLGLYLTPALFKNDKGENHRPRGFVFAWVDAFLLPEVNKTRFPFSVNLKGTIDLARKELERDPKKKQFVFLDCTGVTCTNCKYNEESIFSRPDVRDLLLEFRLVQHYTDEVPKQFYPPDSDVDDVRRVDEAKNEDKKAPEKIHSNLDFQKKLFGTEQLPLYVIFEVTKDNVFVRGVYEEGKINDTAAFIKFLTESRKEKKK